MIELFLDGICEVSWVFANCPDMIFVLGPRRSDVAS